MHGLCVVARAYDVDRRKRINALILQQIRENQNFINIKEKKYGNNQKNYDNNRNNWGMDCGSCSGNS